SNIETSMRSPEPILRGGAVLGTELPGCWALPANVCAKKRTQNAAAHANVFAILFSFIFFLIAVGPIRRCSTLQIAIPKVLGVHTVAVSVEVLQAHVDIVDDDSGEGRV